MGGKKNNRWLDLAEAEANALMRALPVAVRDKLSGVSITVSRRPSADELLEDGDSEDLLGLFVGAPISEEFDDSGLPPSIRLFADNILDSAEGDAEAFKLEVRKTLLHEIGHYLGLDEDGLELRGLA